MINIVFFAKYREMAGVPSLCVEPAGRTTVREVIEALKASHPTLETLFADQKLHIAVNQRLATMANPVVDGDEVAFFPPVTGG